VYLENKTNYDSLLKVVKSLIFVLRKKEWDVIQVVEHLIPRMPEAQGGSHDKPSNLQLKE
jgi:hypothetical protein